MEWFEFGHPYGDIRQWARKFAEAAIRERNPQCLPSIDWDTMDIEDAIEDCNW